jgi:hypothetical protein
MESSDLLNSQGQIINFGLFNCVDPLAKCQVKIMRIKKVKIRKEKSRIRTVSGATLIRMDAK